MYSAGHKQNKNSMKFKFDMHNVHICVDFNPIRLHLELNFPSSQWDGRYYKIRVTWSKVAFYMHT